MASRGEEEVSAQQRELARAALDKALDVRDRAGFDDEGPLCIYELCAKLNIRVVFDKNPSMEGMYKAGLRPEIALSSMRPVGRRVFTCGHELGHHVFDHGSSIDELRDQEDAVFQPNEFLANTFSGFVLMPKLGVRNAFHTRNWDIKTATPVQVFAVACHFGVGYETLANHMGHGLKEVSHAHVRELVRTKLPTIRRTLLGRFSDQPLVVADRYYQRPTLDVEVGTQILVPFDVVADSESLGFVEDLANGRLFEARKPGLVRVHGSNNLWAIVVRISRFQYNGLAKHRHVEEVNEDE
jgi:Zn-dependent peptidase ImmA (M78 family)